MKKKTFNFHGVISFITGTILLWLIVIFFFFFPNFKTFYTPLNGAIVEEILKFITVLILISIIKMPPRFILFLGLSFGISEGIWHFLAYDRFDVLPGLVHILLASVMAVFFSLFQNSKYPLLRYVWLLSAFLVPASLHLFYNSLFI